MPVTLDKTLVEQAKLLYLSGKSPVQIGQTLDIKPDTIIKRAKRDKWSIVKDETDKRVKEILDKVVVRALVKQGHNTRAMLASEAEEQATALRESPCAGVGELYTTKEGQGRGALFKTLVEASAKVFGWGDQPMNQVGQDLADFADTVDAEEVKSCGVDATTGGVPSSTISNPPPQLTQGDANK